MDPSVLIKFRNCRIINNNAIISNDIWVRNGKILNPEKIFFDEKKNADVEIDCNNAIIAPGFIDLQINGGYGIDFSFNTTNVEEGIQKVAKGLLTSGVTAFCPTLVTSSSETYRKILPKIKMTNGSKNGATVLGVHLEGPFINTKKKGAHDEKWIKNFDKGIADLVSVYGSLNNVKIITLAPEKGNSSELIKQLTENNIIVSLGHSAANLLEAELAVNCGAALITHLFNAMPPFHHRDPGLVGLLASENIPSNRTIYYGIIADGIHTHPAALRIAYRTHSKGSILVTDAISAMGLKEGVHHIGELLIEVRSGKALIANTDTLCGSIAKMDECVRIFQKSTECSIVNAIAAATLHPAECIGIDNTKGSLNYGCDADFVFLTDDLKVISTWISGECVYENKLLT